MVYMYCLAVLAIGYAKSGACRRRRAHKNVPEEAQTASVLPVQRYRCVRKYHHEQEKG